ncbi:MAG TPA: hypothetical protein VJ032_12170 [Thermoanaerobaculia bacterium]|nr:hypothetical protein [Thermoanaerobaculia bacterium]
MSLRLDAALANTGTRFRIFPQPRFLPSFRNPEVVTVSIPAGQVAAGPADNRMNVIDAINKLPYDGASQPPFNGTKNPPVPPGPAGHFDYLNPDSRAFACATMYATVRRTLDIWEDYFGHPIPWFFEADFEKLELIPLIEWDNAQSGYGFLEFGFGRTPAGGIDHTRPYCENFDVLAHELGHNILFSQTGLPSNPADPAIDYGGYQESGGDLTAIVASMHFNSVVDHLLAQTRGNLFTVNELDRVGELSSSREIRVAFNSKRLGDVGSEPHERSLPLTGGIFDIMVEVFQKKLVAHGLITQDLATRSTQGPGGSPNTAQIQKEFNAAYRNHEAAFKQLLLESRDYLGHLLARTWKSVDPNFLTYAKVVRQILEADRALGNENQETIRGCFAWRGISSPAAIQFAARTLDSCRFGGIRQAVEPSDRAPRAAVAAFEADAQRMTIKRASGEPRAAERRKQPRSATRRPSATK